jgi:hypothetical protein
MVSRVSDFGDLRDKVRALAARLDYDGDTPGAGDAIRAVLEGRRDDREFLLRLHFQAFVKSMREIEDGLRTSGALGLAEDLSKRIDAAVVSQRFDVPDYQGGATTAPNAPEVGDV